MSLVNIKFSVEQTLHCYLQGVGKKLDSRRKATVQCCQVQHDITWKRLGQSSESIKVNVAVIRL